MMNTEDLSDVCSGWLQDIEARAIAVLKITGFGEFISDLESDDAWKAFEAAVAVEQHPFDSTVRARRARSCLLLARLADAANLEGDSDAALRYGLGLGRLDRELLSYMELETVIASRRRAAGLRKAAELRREARIERWSEWKPKADAYKRSHPETSASAVAAHVAFVCEAKFETVRKALRVMRREAAAQADSKKKK
jgi:hypothetical protein